MGVWGNRKREGKRGRCSTGLGRGLRHGESPEPGQPRWFGTSGAFSGHAKKDGFYAEVNTD